MKRRIFGYLILVLGTTALLRAEAPLAAVVASTPELTAALSKLQASYDAMSAMKADFKQTYASKLGSEEKNSGQLVLKKPGQMKWTYKTPKGKYIVSDGERLVLYDPQTKQAIVQPQRQSTKMPVIASLLFGGVNLKESFEIVEGSKRDKSMHLKLKPKEKIPNVQQIELDIDQSTSSKITAVTITDDLGGTNDMQFTGINFNAKVTAKSFDTSIPKGATVVSGSPLP